MNELKWNSVSQWLLWIALPLLLGVIIAWSIPQPVIGVIRLDDAIYSYTGKDLINQINIALARPDVRAVVLAFNTPGGTVVDTEDVYFELSRLRAKKPVVMAINGMAASGGYYLASGVDYIYAKPTSLVGNVGVIGYLPPSPLIFEDIISTGPYKLWGAPRDQDMREIEMVKQGFYQAVTLGRGDRLKIGPETLLRGQIWSGTEALRLGLIDDLGTESDAIRKAAELAHTWHYEVVDMHQYNSVTPPPNSFFLQSPQGVTLPYPTEAGTYLLYIPPLPSQK